MKIGIVGVGVVGSAIKKGFEQLGHEVKVHDLKLKTTIKDVIDTDIVYLCLPTNPKPDGSCDTEALIWTVDALSDNYYKGIVAVKSTIIPGTYETLKVMFPSDRLCLVPEFLREKFAFEDFTQRHNVLVIGTNNEECAKVVRESHGHYPKQTKILTPQECEYVKYFSNVFKAYKTVFANSFGKLCEINGVDYSKILDVYKAEDVKETAYLKYFREGFGGMCLPKDVTALAKFAQDTDIDTFKFILSENNKFNES